MQHVFSVIRRENLVVKVVQPDKRTTEAEYLQCTMYLSFICASVTKQYNLVPAKAGE